MRMWETTSKQMVCISYTWILINFLSIDKHWTPTLSTCPLLLVALMLEFPPLFHSETGHSEYCWEPNWDCELDCIAVRNELMVSSVEGIPEMIKILCIYTPAQSNDIIGCPLLKNTNFYLLSTCANAQNGPLGQYPLCRMSLHLVDL